MPDHDVRQVFDMLDGAPTPEFEATLKQRLLDLVDASGPQTITNTGRGPDIEETIAMVKLDAPESSNRRRMLQIFGAVAAAVVIVIVIVAATGNSDESLTPATAPAAATTAPTTADAATTTEPETTTSTTAVASTTVAPTTVPAPQGPRITLPPDLNPGTYELASAVVPLQFTTTQPWSRVLDFQDRVVLGRGPESADGEFLIVFDRFKDATPETILDGLCTDQAVIGAPTPTTLMGVEAFGAEGTTTTACPASSIGGSGFFIGADRTFTIVAAEIDDHVVVVFSSAPAAVSATFIPEIDEQVSSMQKLG